MAQFDIRQIMNGLPNSINKEHLGGISGIIQLVLSGEGASTWVITLEDQTCKVLEGSVENPDLTLRTDGETGAKIFAGNLDPMRAYMLGKLKVIGDLNLGMKIAKLFGNTKS